MFVDRRVLGLERRRAARVPLVCAVRHHKAGKAHLCLAANISQEGMEVIRVRDAPLAPRSEVTFEFELPGHRDLITAQGRVVFDRDGPRTGVAGVRFDAVSPEHARWIDEYVAKALRTADG